MTLKANKFQSIVLSLSIIFVIAVLAGCGQDERSVGSDEKQAAGARPSTDQQPLGHVREFDGFTLRANVSRTDVLPDAMARKYGIEPETDLFLLNLVILDNRSDQEPEPISAEVRVQHESLIGHVENIDMRAVETDGHVTYIGTLDASDQRHFQLVFEAQPAGTEQLLSMDFEVHLEAFEIDDLD